MFQELADRFPNGTVQLAIQVKNGEMAVMVTFKNIEGIPPRVLKGSPKEIDDSFISELESEFKVVSKGMDRLEAIEKEIEELLKKKKENELLKEQAKKEKEEKEKQKKATQEKEEKLKSAQVGLALDVTDEEDTPTEKPKARATKSKEKITELTEDLKKEIKQAIIDSGAEVWDQFDVAWKKLKALNKSLTDKEAQDLIHSSKVVIELENERKKELAENKQDHKKNVEAMKKDMDSKDSEDDFDPFDDVSVESDVIESEEIDEFEL